MGWFQKSGQSCKWKDIIKADSIEITKDNKYEQIIIAKQRTWKRLEIWVE